MNFALTNRKSPAQRRAANRERAQRWRDSHTERPDPRLVDRLLLQGLVHTLTDGDVLRPGATEILGETVSAAVAGLCRKGVPVVEAKRAVGRRIGEHKSSPTVRAALSEAARLARLETEKTSTA